MARITVNDCIGHVPNRFELVLLAAQRARQLGMGDPPRVPDVDESRTVTALREIAAGAVDPGKLREEVVQRLQRVRPEIATEDTGPEEEEMLARMRLDVQAIQAQSSAVGNLNEDKSDAA